MGGANASYRFDASLNLAREAFWTIMRDLPKTRPVRTLILAVLFFSLVSVTSAYAYRSGGMPIMLIFLLGVVIPASCIYSSYKSWMDRESRLLGPDGRKRAEAFVDHNGLKVDYEGSAVSLRWDDVSISLKSSKVWVLLHDRGLHTALPRADMPQQFAEILERYLLAEDNKSSQTGR